MEDKNTLGMTPENSAILEKMFETGYFENRMVAAKFAMSIAIGKKVKVGKLDPSPSTTWNIGSFDPDGKLKELVGIMFPETDTPYRTVEFLLNAGLELVGKSIKELGHLDLERLMSHSRDDSR